MANTKKKITIHPVSGSNVDQTTDLFPKTTIDQIYESDGETRYSFKGVSIEYDSASQALKITSSKS